jgi:hypothetical protein
MSLMDTALTVGINVARNSVTSTALLARSQDWERREGAIVRVKSQLRRAVLLFVCCAADSKGPELCLCAKGREV